MRQPFKWEQVQKVGVIVEYYYSPGGNLQALWSAAIYRRFGLPRSGFCIFWATAGRSFLPGGTIVRRATGKLWGFGQMRLRNFRRHPA
jgi:hypothetical protein